MQIGNYIKVFDKEANILLSGQIKVITDNPKGYSVDGIFFVNPNSKKFNIIKEEKPIEQLYNTKCESDSYILYKHNNIDNTFDYDFFMWTEIEPEVKETVDLLNSLNFIKTYSSCSGHGKIPSYIDFNILNFEKFFNFLIFINENGIQSYCNKHQEIEDYMYKIRFLVGVEGKDTCHLELVEINQTFDKLNKIIKKYKLQQC